MRNHVIIIDENGIPNTILIDRATPVGNKFRCQNTRDVFQSSSPDPHEAPLLDDYIQQDEFVVYKIVGHR